MSPRSKEQFKKMRNQSRTQIIRAALDQFIQNGYRDTSIQMIAVSAGISKGLVYNYFDSKEAILKAVLENSFSDIESKLKILNSIGDPRKRLAHHIEKAVESIKNNPGFWKMHHQLLSNPSTNPIIKTELIKFLSLVRKFVEKILNEISCSNPHEKILIFEATFDGMINRYILSDGTYPIDIVKNHLINTYCQVVNHDRKTQ
ncbi:MAG: TetR/AcrR family transcriptional regulator [Fidelibacterota bacterium]